MILVVGATGSLGRKITHGLRDRNEDVRILARPSSDYAALDAAGARVAFGDLTDRVSLDRACRDCAAVVTTASVSKTGTDSIENVDLHGNQELIAAARTAGVRHFVFVSTISASADSPIPLFRAKGEAELRLREGPIAYTILQPNAFMDVWFPMLVEMPAFAGRPITLVGESRRKHSFVAEKDVAAFAVAALSTPAARNQTIVIGGPDAVTLRDVVKEYEKAAGRSFPVRSVAPGDPIPGVPEPVWGLAAALETYDSPIPMGETSRIYGVRLTNVGDFVSTRVSASVNPR